MSKSILSRLAYGKYPQTIGRAKRNKAGEMAPRIIEDHARTALAPPRKLDATERLEKALQRVIDECSDRILTLEVEIQNREDELADIQRANSLTGKVFEMLGDGGWNDFNNSLASTAALNAELQNLWGAQMKRGGELRGQIEDRRRELSDVRDAHAAALAGLAALPSRIEAICADAIIEELSA